MVLPALNRGCAHEDFLPDQALPSSCFRHRRRVTSSLLDIYVGEPGQVTSLPLPLFTVGCFALSVNSPGHFGPL